MKSLLKVGYGCNDHCAFCHTLDVRHIDGEAKEIVAKIHRAKALGHSMVVLSGGEPTIRPELVAWARLTASLDMDFGLVTNGRMLAYKELAEELLESRLKYVYLSLHGGTAKVHDLMVRSRAFDETYGSLANLSGRGLDLHVNCVVTKNNMRHLRGVVDALAPYEDAQLKFSMVEPKGGGDKLFHRLMPRVRDVAEHVLDALRYADEQGVRAQHGALPFCLMKGYEARFDDLKTHRFRTMCEIGEPDLFPVDDRNKLHPPACEGCVHRGACPGLYRGYHEAFGDEELRAVRDGVRSNSFNYVFEGVVARGVPESFCPLRDGDQGITPWDRGRDLFVRHGERVARFRSESRDFSDVEIADVKHASGQVYYDVSTKDAPDDFARDLAKLRRSALCEGCNHRETCTGLFDVDLEPVFTRDNERLLKVLGDVRGDVLDVGCGEGPYVGAFGPAARRGELNYVGVDPSEGSIAQLRRAHPWASLHVGTGESLGGAIGEQRFDLITVLRSWNHLGDPGATLAALRKRVRAEGMLIVADNVAFGLARTRAQHRRGTRSSAEFEHHRNDSAAEARRVLEAGEWRVETCWAVSPDTSNQWVLFARPR